MLKEVTERSFNWVDKKRFALKAKHQNASKWFSVAAESRRRRTSAQVSLFSRGFNAHFTWKDEATTKNGLLIGLERVQRLPAKAQNSFWPARFRKYFGSTPCRCQKRSTHYKLVGILLTMVCQRTWVSSVGARRWTKRVTEQRFGNGTFFGSDSSRCSTRQRANSCQSLINVGQNHCSSCRPSRQ